jgi:hypothetical protein
MEWIKEGDMDKMTLQRTMAEQSTAATHAMSSAASELLHLVVQFRSARQCRAQSRQCGGVAAPAAIREAEGPVGQPQRPLSSFGTIHFSVTGAPSPKRVTPTVAVAGDVPVEHVTMGSTQAGTS